MATKAHLEGNKRYLEKLDHITIRVQGGTKEKIKARAQQEGMSLNAYIAVSYTHLTLPTIRLV